jgi:hypothetical protein
MHEPMNAVAAAVVLMGVAVVVAAVVVGFAFAIRAASREPERPRAPLEQLTDAQLSRILDGELMDGNGDPATMSPPISPFTGLPQFVYHRWGDPIPGPPGDAPEAP